MPMPRNAKIGEYCSVSDDANALDFREIAAELSKMGHTMGCSTARNHLVSGLKKIAYAIAVHYGAPCSDRHMLAIAASPEFQSSMHAFLQDDAAARRMSRR